MGKKIVLVGAGSLQFGYSTMGDVFSCETLKGSTLTLHDINQQALDRVVKGGKEFVEKHKLPYTIEGAIDRKEALKGADFVVISIEVGDRFRLWEQDRTVPQQFGITQIYGENGGPGGIFHALRITPPILEICGDVMDICPDAWVFNYSNPMSRICTTVKRAYPELKLIGMCHEIASLERYIPEILGTPYENLKMRAAGLNHFSVLLEASYKDSGKDAYPDVRAKAPDFFANAPGFVDILNHTRKTGDFVLGEGERSDKTQSIDKISQPWADRGIFKVILEQFGYLPITLDSHFGEYISWAHDAADMRGIIDFLVWYEMILAQGTENVGIKLERHERVTYIMEGLINDTGYEEEAVNIPNNGLIPGLPDDLVVEVPAKVNASGLTGIAFPDYPKGVLGLLKNQVAVHDLNAEAILKKSKDLVIQALLVDPVTNKSRRIPELVDMMIAMQEKYLGYLK